MTHLKEGVRHPVATVHRLFEEVAPDEVVQRLPRQMNGVKLWAVRNAYTLIFLSFCFAVTWVLLLVTR